MHDDKRPILLVEDNPMDLDLTMRAFQRQKIDYPVLIARDGEEALKYLEKWDSGEKPARMVLLDLKIPRVDGLEVLERIRRHPHYGNIPVIILSSSSDQRDLCQAYDLGANSYIVKPVDYKQFLEVAVQIIQYWCNINLLCD
jgi:CheY-like chemotaxis protein